MLSVAAARDTLNVYGASDYAVTSHGGDYTAHVVIGVDPENRMYLLDLWRASNGSATSALERFADSSQTSHFCARRTDVVVVCGSAGLLAGPLIPHLAGCLPAPTCT
jgi:hypothetical protein